MRGSAAAIAAGCCVALLVAASFSTPRRVGDGGEYFVLAARLASFRHPALTRAEIEDTRQTLQALGAGFESSLLDYPRMVASDGRQDFLHFWLYPLLVAPLVPIAHALGLHPNWAFTLFNVLALGTAIFLVLRHEPAVAMLAAFASPIVWWVDKAHTEAFLFAAVAAAAVMVHRAPAASLILYALAGAQNAAIGVTFPLFAAMQWAALRRARTHGWTSREWIALAAGAAIVLLPMAYTWRRLGRLSAMAEYATVAVPRWNGLAGFIVDPNIGLAPSAPVYVAALVCGVRLARRADVRALYWWPAVIQATLLLVWSQNPNANHGGTPDMNRWVLTLLALSVPWIGAAHRAAAPAGRRVLAGFVGASAVWSLWFYAPARPENYLRPTRLAEAMWSAGWVGVTPAEVFAERAQRQEPPRAPAFFGPCATVLVVNLQWPLPCVPPSTPLPASCRRAEAMCYVIGPTDARRVVTTANNGFFYEASVPSWPAGGPLAAGIARVLAESDPTAAVWRPEPVRTWVERAEGVTVESILRSERAIVVYVSRTAASATLTLRTPGFTAATVYRLIPLALTTTTFSGSGESVPVSLPPDASNLAIALVR